LLADDIGLLLRKKKLTVATAESCTGGKVGDWITEVSGSSDYYLGGIVSYSNEAKVRLLGVDSKTLASKGAVSEEVALQMASGARNALGANIGVSTTGIAGPTGATKNKPVGLVYIAVSSSKGSVCTENRFAGSRHAVKNQSAEKALEMLIEFIKSKY
jgi:nicotinamide-nucleotide amidase